MSTVFISYAREDRDKAKLLAAVIAARGWSVFWDYTIPPGKLWDEFIEAELDAAQAVVVLWTAASVESPHVKAEAHEGLTRGVLVPALVEDVRLPLSFRRIHAAPLLDWTGDPTHAGLAVMLGALSNMLAGTDAAISDAADDSRLDAPDVTTDAAAIRATSRTLSAEPEMVTIPAGSFAMGSDSAEGGPDDERPVRAVTIARPFAIGKHAVTFDEYDAFVVATGGRSPGDAGWGRGRRPVVDVSWNRAVAYATWLAEQTGRHYRLPSEAEWEYAARAGTTTPYWWGDQPQPGEQVMANFKGCGSKWGGKRTAPVGQFEANAFGLHDMHGNVWEWVQDCWHPSYRRAPTDGRAWLEAGGGECGLRVLRGGCWDSQPLIIRSADRDGSECHGANYFVGFRVAMDL